MIIIHFQRLLFIAVAINVSYAVNHVAIAITLIHNRFLLLTTKTFWLDTQITSV